jgi:hypothetical protein
MLVYNTNCLFTIIKLAANSPARGGRGAGSMERGVKEGRSAEPAAGHEWRVQSKTESKLPHTGYRYGGDEGLRNATALHAFFGARRSALDAGSLPRGANARLWPIRPDRLHRAAVTRERPILPPLRQWLGRRQLQTGEGEEPGIANAWCGVMGRNHAHMGTT